MTRTDLDRALAAARDTREILLGSGVVDRVGEVAGRLFPPGAVAQVVADGTTWALAGERVTGALAAAGLTMAEPLVFPAAPAVYAGYENVERVRDALADSGACAVSVGSGTLNDLTKLASGELGRPYVHVCTAASQDGYAAFGAAITRDGFKITRTCPAPAGIVADLDVMATAPSRMVANGYGDMVEKWTGGADWIVAAEVGVEPIDPAAWEMVQGPLDDALGDPAAIAAADPAALERLIEEILLSGLAIQAYQTSRPGSGAGHNFSHQWEMEGHGLDWPLPLSHGAKVAVGTVAMAALYDAALAIDPGDVDVDELLARWPDAAADEARVRALHDHPVIADAAVTYSAKKYVPREEVPARVAAIRAAWPRIVERCRAQLPTAAELVERLETIGAPSHPEQIEISLAKLHRTYYQAQTIRDRYTLMDLLVEIGRFDEVVDALFAPGGYWAERAVPAWKVAHE